MPGCCTMQLVDSRNGMHGVVRYGAVPERRRSCSWALRTALAICGVTVLLCAQCPSQRGVLLLHNPSAPRTVSFLSIFPHSWDYWGI